MQAFLENQKDLPANVCADLEIPVFARHIEPQLHGITVEQI